MEKKIRVLHITQSVGGVETYIKQVAQHIDRQRFEIMVAGCEPSLQNFCFIKSIPYFDVKMSRGFNPFLDIKSVFSLRKLIKKTKPDFVHLHSSKAGFVGRIAAKTARCKSLFTPHGVSYLSFTGFKRMAFFMLEMIGKKFTYKVLAISHSEANRLVHEIGIKEELIYVIPNSLTSAGLPANIPNTLGVLEGTFKVGTIGRLTPQKNPLLFIDIANDIIKNFPNVHFYFLGAGFHDHLRDEVEQMIKQLGIESNCHLIDKGDHIVAINFLRQLNVFLLPSVFEGLPYSLLEAMREGVPCVVSKCDGNNDVINNNDNGFACMTRNEYFDVISNLIRDPATATAIGERGRAYVEKKHNVRTNMQLLEAIYSKMGSGEYVTEMKAPELSPASSAVV